MADNTSIKDSENDNVIIATDELNDGSQSPKVSILGGDGSVIPISPATSGKQDSIITALGTVVAGLTNIISAIQGTLTVATHAVTQSGAWVLSAGSAIIGRVGIDQTTPGTTNKVSIGSDGIVGIGAVAGRKYETVAASQTAQVLGGAGAQGDDIDGILVIPATTSPGNIILLDGTTSITVFAGGADSVSNLVPFFIPLGLRSVDGAWKVTTGANISVIGIGNFS